MKTCKTRDLRLNENVQKRFILVFGNFLDNNMVKTYAIKNVPIENVQNTFSIHWVFHQTDQF